MLDDKETVYVREIVKWVKRVIEDTELSDESKVRLIGMVF